MYPLLLKPAFKDYVWGGDALSKLYGMEKQRIAESWTLSDRKDGECTVQNGKYKDMTLSNVLALWGTGKLPHLVKLIDTKEKLSLQVHPDDAFALENERERGKSEVWYIIDNNEENAGVFCGVKEFFTKAEIIEKAKDGTLEEALVFHKAEKGAAFKILSGCPHGIGSGIFLAEVQDSSDITYRLYDYGRNTRQLHLEKAEKVLNVGTDSGRIIPKESFFPCGSAITLWEKDSFKACIFSFDGETKTVKNNKFLSFTILEGSLQLETDSESFSVCTGYTALVPPDTGFAFSGKGQFLITEF